MHEPVPIVLQQSLPRHRLEKRPPVQGVPHPSEDPHQPPGRMVLLCMLPRHHNGTSSSCCRFCNTSGHESGHDEVECGNGRLIGMHAIGPMCVTHQDQSWPRRFPPLSFQHSIDLGLVSSFLHQPPRQQHVSHELQRKGEDRHRVHLHRGDGGGGEKEVSVGTWTRNITKKQSHSGMERGTSLEWRNTRNSDVKGIQGRMDLDAP